MKIIYKIIPYAIIIISVIVNILQFKGCSKDKEIKQSNSNQISGDVSREVVYTVEEVQQFLADHDSSILATIKPKIIKHIIKAELNYEDSQKIANKFNNPDYYIDTNKYDSDVDVRFIDMIDKCQAVNVVSFPDTSIISTHFNSDILTIMFEQYKYNTFIKRILHWFNFSKYNDCITILECSGDTLKVEKNIKVIKK